MATETLNINVINETWAGASGVATDIDEPIASADGNLYGPGADGDTAKFGLTNPSVIVDADTVTNVSITLRLKKGGTSGNEQGNIALYIGGVSKGSINTANLTTSFADYGPLNNGGWNVDWTLAELQGAEVGIVPQQVGMPGTVAVDIDCADVVVTYTPAGATPVTANVSSPGVLTFGPPGPTIDAKSPVTADVSSPGLHLVAPPGPTINTGVAIFSDTGKLLFSTSGPTTQAGASIAESGNVSVVISGLAPTISAGAVSEVSDSGIIRIFAEGPTVIVAAEPSGGIKAGTLGLTGVGI